MLPAARRGSAPAGGFDLFPNTDRSGGDGAVPVASPG